jgi:hypothetical protein
MIFVIKLVLSLIIAFLTTVATLWIYHAPHTDAGSIKVLTTIALYMIEIVLREQAFLWLSLFLCFVLFDTLSIGFYWLRFEKVNRELVVRPGSDGSGPILSTRHKLSCAYPVTYIFILILMIIGTREGITARLIATSME